MEEGGDPRQPLSQEDEQAEANFICGARPLGLGGGGLGPPSILASLIIPPRLTGKPPLRPLLDNPSDYTEPAKCQLKSES